MQLAFMIGSQLMTAATTAGSALGITGTGAAAGASVASSAGVGAGWLSAAGANTAATSGLMGNLAMAGNALSAFSMFAGGMAEKREAEAAALEARYAAQQSLLQGVQEGNEILDGVIDQMAKTRVAYANAGLDPFSGTPAAQIARIGRDGERDINVSKSDALVRYLAGRRSMKSLRQRGAASGLTGVIGAAGQLAEGYADWKARG